MLKRPNLFSSPQNHLDKLSWQYHLKLIQKKISSSIFALSRTKHFLPLHARKCIYNSLVASHLSFGAIIYGSTRLSNLKHLYTLQKKAIRLVSLSKRSAHSNPLFYSNNLLNLPDLIRYDKICFMHKLRYMYLPESFNNILLLKSEHGTDRIRSDVGNFSIPQNNTGLYFPLLESAREWNSFPYSLKIISKICF